jgi:hypothetical protein
VSHWRVGEADIESLLAERALQPVTGSVTEAVLDAAAKLLPHLPHLDLFG